MMENQELEQWADCRNTSKEVAEAIFLVADDEEDADRLWQDATDEEIRAVWEHATKRGLIDDSDMFWGNDSLEEMRLGVGFSKHQKDYSANYTIN